MNGNFVLKIQKDDFNRVSSAMKLEQTIQRSKNYGAHIIVRTLQVSYVINGNLCITKF